MLHQKCTSIIQEYELLQSKLYEPEILSNIKELTIINRTLNRDQKLYDLSKQYLSAYLENKEAKQILNDDIDPDMIELAKQQLGESASKLDTLEELLKQEMIPKDPNDEKDSFVEIRPAAGGDEAGLFGAELFKCYCLYADQMGWKYDIIEQQLSDIGGVKLIIMKISGNKVYSRMKYESGVHRVQRVPATESQGRVHTSTITVAIMPEAEEVDFQINPNDVEMDTYAASSSGGQNANKNQTGVRLRHIPSGIIVTIGDSKSQLQNKDKAWSVLRSRLYQIEQEKIQNAEKAARGAQIGTGERSEKIKTYNYPQDRITDHRIKQSWSNLPIIMMGNIGPLIDACIVADQHGALGVGDNE
ncbi:MAG TPA: peptide chain release factor 1 [Candidatus Absconditabacterales bacterium]|nr:peptide chain release factor 1 [Candidatus Absconditabacterales bacterium]HNG97237.1 peptide chain release factor 1 [Candidatus Absconditabacterales bacterium]